MKSHWTWLGGVVLIILALLVGLRSTEHAPARTNFDSASAFATLTRINPENQAHPIGSAHNRLIRARIEAELRALGYAPEIQADLICTDLAPGCSFVENIVAMKDGAGDDVILVTAHYDSAPIAPGAGDDLAGVAVMLEIARRMAATPTQNDIVFLFTDGEEAGLRGAMAFAHEHPLMQRVDLVLNMEARGVSGPSAMFETSTGAAPLIQAFAQSAPHPVANSLFYEVYRRMPNNTDVTIYKSAGAMAMNFAFSRGVALYHSARDDNAHLSPPSMAHHGENIAAVLEALQDTPLESLRNADDATYFDIFGQTLLHWPSALNLPLAGVLLALVFALAFARKAIRLRRLGWASLAVVTLIVGHLTLGWALSLPLGVWPGIHPLDHPAPWPARIALISSSVLLSLLVGTLFARRASAATLLFASWLLLALIGVALGAFLAGGAYIAIVPVGVFAIIAACETVLRRPPVIAACVGAVVAAYMALYHFLNLDVVFNFQVAYLKTPVLLLISFATAPIAAWCSNGLKGARAPIALVGLACIGAAIAGALVPPYTHDRPRAVNVDYLQITNHNGTRAAQWRLETIGPPDAAHAAATGFPNEVAPYLRWGLRDAKAYLRPAPDLALAEPPLRIHSVQTLADGARTIEGELQSGRNGFIYGLTFASGAAVREFWANDERLAQSEAFENPRGVTFTFSGVGDRVMRFRLVTRSSTPVTATLFEVSSAPVHPDMAAIIAARPDTAAPIHFGDHAEVQRQVTF